jgi:hypothetical protein
LLEIWYCMWPWDPRSHDNVYLGTIHKLSNTVLEFVYPLYPLRNTFIPYPLYPGKMGYVISEQHPLRQHQITYFLVKPVFSLNFKIKPICFLGDQWKFWFRLILVNHMKIKNFFWC